MTTHFKLNANGDVSKTKLRKFPDSTIIDQIMKLAGDEKHHLRTLYGDLLREHNFIVKQIKARGKTL